MCRVQGGDAPAHRAVVHHVIVNERRNVNNFSDLGKARLQQRRETRAEASNCSCSARTNLSFARNAAALSSRTYQIHEQRAEVFARLPEIIGRNVVEDRIVAAHELPDVLEQRLHFVL
jgi:hypothetical protein